MFKLMLGGIITDVYKRQDVLEVLLIVQFIQIALHGSVGRAGQLHRIGKMCIRDRS